MLTEHVPNDSMACERKRYDIDEGGMATCISVHLAMNVA